MDYSNLIGQWTIMQCTKFGWGRGAIYLFSHGETCVLRSSGDQMSKVLAAEMPETRS